MLNQNLAMLPEYNDLRLKNEHLKKSGWVNRSNKWYKKASEDGTIMLYLVFMERASH